MRYIAFLAVLVAALTLAPSAAAAPDWAWPVRGDVVSPYKNGDDPYASGQHRGIDIAAPVGARVGAAVGGRVTYAGVAGSSGLTVSVRTGDGRYDVSYLHLSAAAVREGDRVDRGQALGAVGTSGRRSAEQPHLHFGVREGGDRHAYRDPLDFLPPLAPPVTDSPPAAPVGAPDPVAAPPAAAPVLTRAPAGVTTEALAPLPAGGAVAVLGVQEGPAHAGAPGTAAATPLGGEASSADGATAPQAHHRSGPVASRHHAPSPAAPSRRAPGSSSPASRALRSAPVTRAHASPGPAASGRAGGGRAVTRSDLAAPAHASTAPRSNAAEPPARLAVSDRRAASPRSHGGGLNLGWLVAVLGLMAAATCMGRPQAARRAARTGRGAVGAVLRPLAGRG